MHSYLRNGYRLLTPQRSRKSNRLRDVILPLTFGFVLGMYLGGLFGSTQTEKYSSYVKEVVHRNISFDSIFFLRCVIMMSPSAKKPGSSITAIKKTYGQMCNQTMFYSNNPKLHKKVKDQKIKVVDQTSSPAYWNFYRDVMMDSSEVPAQWTIFLDEQVFLENSHLREMLETFNSNDSLLLGRVVSKRSFSNIVLPWMSTDKLATQGGVVMTSSAIQKLSECSFLLPYSSENALLRCALAANVTVIDPIDEDGMYLMNYQDLKTLVPVAYGKTGKTSDGIPCCSDYSVTFGQQTHKEILMAHFATTKWRVFGNAGIDVFDYDNTTSSTSVNKTTTTTKAAKVVDKLMENKLLTNNKTTT